MLNTQWDKVLQDEFGKPYFKSLQRKTEEAYATQTVFPPQERIYAAFRAVDYDEVKVVILGQDPYHGAGQANGLAFAVGDGVAVPPSLRNIFKELSADLGCAPPTCGTLTGWAEQGVLLLNTVLTVQSGRPASHVGFGWQTFTDAVITAINRREDPLAFILWGANAGAKRSRIADRHFVVESAHPSPMSASRGFFGSKPFSAVNAFLIGCKKPPIDWANTAGTR